MSERDECIADYAGCRQHMEQLTTFRSRVLDAFAKGHIHCDCAGICHDADCPLGDLEVEADHIWRASLGIE